MLTREDYLQLYFNTEVARRANIREDRKLTQEQERLRKCYNLALLKQEMDFQAEKSKQLDLEEMKMAAETAEEEKEQERRNARNGAHGISKAYSEYTTSTNMNSEDKKLQDLLKLPKINYHGYISEPGSNFKSSKMRSNKIKDNDIVKKQFALTDNWIREENLRIQKQQKLCRKLLKAEKIQKKLAVKKMDQFTEDSGNWIVDILEEDERLKKEAEAEKIALKEATGDGERSKSYEDISDSDSDASTISKTESEIERSKSLNAIRDNFLRLFFKYDSKDPKTDIGAYLKYKDSPPRVAFPNLSKRNSISLSHNLISSNSRRSSLMPGSRRASFQGGSRRSSMQSNVNEITAGQLSELDPAMFLAELDNRRSSMISNSGELSHRSKKEHAPEISPAINSNRLSLPEINFATARRTRYLRWPDNPKFERELTFERILE